uniref:Uncharacterized protein n=1 Tax=Candidatus Methanophagaceae archaeon ANME-1 ERB6 TaxID=2759912 RepID=A0A7G9YV10_9EURY|nr:hypothetical protein PAJCOBIN_00004 [Methanosarcinales archaeon ANME-1 ERB6]
MKSLKITRFLDSALVYICGLFGLLELDQQFKYSWASHRILKKRGWSIGMSVYGICFCQS